MPIKAPNIDDVFARWLNKTPSGKIEKAFGFSKSDVSTAESVKDTDKSVLFYFVSMVKPTGKTEKSTTVAERVKAEQLKKYTLYSFKGKVEKGDWKEKSIEVYSFDDIKEIPCKDCQGKGYLNCKACNGKGRTSCKKCENKGKITCKRCEKTPGNLEIEVDVINEKGKKNKKTVIVPCPECNGDRLISCPECGGKGGGVCQKCTGTGRKKCKACDGTGKLFDLIKIPVPFNIDQREKRNFFYSKKYEKELASVGKDLTDVALKEVEGIAFSDLKKLNSELASSMGEIKLDKDTENNMKQTIKTCETLKKEFEKKKGIEKPLMPVVAYPMSILYIETKKKKKFKIFSLGSEKRFVVFDRGF
ncbi:MAG: hypothetical protein ACTSRU_02880 [Candidatus Hodarchaeales archaeon]